MRSTDNEENLGVQAAPSVLGVSALVSFDSITKNFGATEALRGVSFSVAAGETVGLLGANGAGKSTLIKTLAGIHQPTSGRIVVAGKERVFLHPDDARNAGIATVHQNIDDGVVFGMTVAENLMLDEIAKPGGTVFLGNHAIMRRAHVVQQRLKLDLPLTAAVEDLPPSRRQEVAIARELAKNPKLLILDEPTSTLSEREAEKLFDAIADFKQRGIAILYISHRLSEIERLCDRAVVLRDGKIVSEHTAPMDTKAIASSILGELVLAAENKARKGYETVATFSGLTALPESSPISFNVRRGEVLGLTGLIGAGKTELLEQICGHRTATVGDMQLAGADYAPKDVAAAVAAGVVLVPEQRALQSIFPDENLWKHCSISLLSQFSNNGFMRRRREIAFAADVIQNFRVVCSGPNDRIGELSGGNQQKLLVGRWLSRDWKLLVLDEPFRGIDIGARSLISRSLREYSEKVPVILCSSDPEEVIEVADRIIIMLEGEIVHEDISSNLNAEKLAAIMGRSSSRATPQKGELTRI